MSGISHVWLAIVGNTKSPARLKGPFKALPTCSHIEAMERQLPDEWTLSIRTCLRGVVHSSNAVGKQVQCFCFRYVYHQSVVWFS